MYTRTGLMTLLAVCVCGGAAFAEEKVALPKAWLDAWNAPPVELRPMQIVHGVADARATLQWMMMLKNAGLGGIVCNVAFDHYLESEENWAIFKRAIQACREAGLVVWIYDEEGYPSAGAGGLVLRQHPELEVQVLAYDPSLPEPFFIRRAYEFTHASNNVHGKRRYPNLIEPAATPAFIRVTHEAYAQRIGSELGTTVRAFFTDEPSLMTVHLGDLNARVIDPVDPNAKLLATVPWCSDMEKLYRERYGEELMAMRKSLFTGDEPADRAVRQRFWALVADLVSQRYFGQLQTWCEQHHVASSGHSLWEEYLVHHVPLYGNSLKCLGRMDIPGLDMLSSNPMTVIRGRGWMAALMPASAAIMNGRRRVMTEVSDYEQVVGGKGGATLPMMEATAGWQAAFGVTEFTSYYGSLGSILRGVPKDGQNPDAQKVRAYCDFVGRLNAILRDAMPAPTVLLYYPIHDLWAEYKPVAARLTPETQSPRLQKIANSFWNDGTKLTMTQFPFAFADHELLASTKVEDGKLCIARQRFSAIVLPEGVELPREAQAAADRFSAAGGCIVRGALDARAVARLAGVQEAGRLSLPCEHIVLGRFVRDGREVLVLVNVGDKEYRGGVSIGSGNWTVADPADGQMRTVSAEDGSVKLVLPPSATRILIGSASVQ